MLRITIYAVGEGDCILVQLPDGRVGLVDCCVPPWSNEPPPLRDIRALGGRLDFVCLTHAHHDHYGGLLELITKYEVELKEFWHPFESNLYEVVRSRCFVPSYAHASSILSVLDYETRRTEFVRLMDVVRSLPRGSERFLIEGRSVNPKGVSYEISVLGPTDADMVKYTRRLREAWVQKREPESAWENEVSGILLVRYGQARILLGGDALESNWRQVAEGGKLRSAGDLAHCYKASHHGSGTSFYDGMWSDILVDGGTVVVSAGGSRLASKRFVMAVPRDHVLHCTGKGPYCYEPSGQPAFRHLDGLSRDEDTAECYGQVKIEVDEESHVSITTARSPSREELNCRERGLSS